MVSNTNNLALLCCFFFGIIHAPMYSTCLPPYLRAYVPTYLLYDLSLYWLLNYLRRSNNLLTYLLTYVHTYITNYLSTYLHTCIPTYLHTCIPTYLYYLHSFFGIIYLPMYSTCLPTYLHAYIPIMYSSLLYLIIYIGVAIYLRTY